MKNKDRKRLRKLRKSKKKNPGRHVGTFQVILDDTFEELHSIVLRSFRQAWNNQIIFGTGSGTVTTIGEFDAPDRDTEEFQWQVQGHGIREQMQAIEETGVVPITEPVPGGSPYPQMSQYTLRTALRSIYDTGLIEELSRYPLTSEESHEVRPEASGDTTSL